MSSPVAVVTVRKQREQPGLSFCARMRMHVVLAILRLVALRDFPAWLRGPSLASWSEYRESTRHNKAFRQRIGGGTWTAVERWNAKMDRLVFGGPRPIGCLRLLCKCRWHA